MDPEVWDYPGSLEEFQLDTLHIFYFEMQYPEKKNKRYVMQHHPFYPWRGRQMFRNTENAQ